jgi:hypothetical protein
MAQEPTAKRRQGRCVPLQTRTCVLSDDLDQLIPCRNPRVQGTTRQQPCPVLLWAHPETVPQPLGQACGPSSAPPVTTVRIPLIVISHSGRPQSCGRFDGSCATWVVTDEQAQGAVGDPWLNLVQPLNVARIEWLPDSAVGLSRGATRCSFRCIARQF